MEFDDLKINLSAFINSDQIISNLIFILRNNESIYGRQAIIDQQTQEELTVTFRNYLLENILYNEAFSLLPLSKADERKSVLYRYDIDDLPKELKEIKELYQDNSTQVFNHSEDNLSKLKGIGLQISSSSNKLLLYKQHYPVQFMKNTKNFSIKRLRNESRFEKLQEDIIKINTSLDFFFFNDECFIQNLNVVEKYFGVHEAIINTAISGISKIKETELLEDTKPLEDRISDISFARKLIRAERNSPVLGAISNTDIIEFTKQHLFFKDVFEYTSDNKKIILNTKTSSDKFLLMLNDDYLRSELTQKRYSIRAKDEIT
ncbi:DUF4868 domain-containing protein [Leptospira ognonensis]|uniref:DUF4868 domain-containing protein n=1 Tax=Leptospira ognonensis TaxID=2484945 RepID=A0A4R9JZ72_9LEPT|nr:anti-phage protein KwaB [Leptospira ognonensis]TGL58679.1 DUF4868 domain-containing protein [Leptospira ognonensis]